jgi:hypothetical protein
MAPHAVGLREMLTAVETDREKPQMRDGRRL